VVFLATLFGSHLSEAGLVARARQLLERCRRLGTSDPAAARRLLRREARLVQPAFGRDASIREDLVRLLFEVRRACGEVAGPQPEVVPVPWGEVEGRDDLARRCAGVDAVLVQCADVDVVSEAEAVCALGEGDQVALALIGEGPAMALRAGFVKQAVPLLPADLPAGELPEALRAAALRLGLEVRRC